MDHKARPAEPAEVNAVLVLSMRRIVRRMIFVILFFLLTLIVSAGIRLLTDWLRMPDPYDAPSGHAVKVFMPYRDAEGGQPAADRLRLFYLTGE